MSGHVRTPRPLPASELRRILVVRPDNIGDVVMIGPAVRAIHEAAPGSRITLLASPAGALAAPLLPWVDDVLVERVSWQQLDPGDGGWDPGRDEALIERLREGRFDAAFIFTSFSQSPWPAAYACLLAGIPIRVGRELGFGGALLTHVAPAAVDGTHQVERSLRLLEAVGIAVADRRLHIEIPADARRAAEATLDTAGVDPRGAYVVLAPGASCEARRMPPALAVETARRLLDRTGSDAGGSTRPRRAAPAAPVVLVGGAKDVVPTAPIAGLDGVRSIVGRTSIPELAAVIAGARLLVTAHSAPMHLADAVGTPVVVAFSGTDREAEWGPRAAPARLLRRETPCAPCRGLTCPIGLACLDLDPAAIVAAGWELLGGSPVTNWRAA
jgi:ADP-heptose:LPS heptosyltransferase